VPDDVAVAGFDDIEDGRYARPSLTTVQPGRAEIARVAVDLLMDRLSETPARPCGEEVVVSHQLVVRESTGQGH
jgi:DNA-binding LacI/PurR family transcriptional regulator